MNIEKLLQLYNTLMLIETRGESSYIMVDCLRALNKMIQELKGDNG